MSDVEISNILKDTLIVDKLKKLILMQLKDDILFDDNITLTEDVFKKCMSAVGIQISSEVSNLFYFIFLLFSNLKSLLLRNKKLKTMKVEIKVY
jgi:hypothetical protein